MNRFNTLWIWVVGSTLLVGLLSAVHEMTYQDELRAQRVYCEMQLDGEVPAGSVICNQVG